MSRCFSPSAIRPPAFAVVLCAAAALFASGCSADRSVQLPSSADNALSRDHLDAVRAAAADPLVVLRRCAQKSAELQQYTVNFTRIERRGLLRNLEGPERIACWYRRTPLAVRMRWLDENVKFGEAAYDHTADAERVRFVPRNGFLGFPPGVVAVNVNTPVTWGESRYPITDFGLGQLMVRTMENVDQAGAELKMEYDGLTCMRDTGRLAHLFHMTFPRPKFPNPVLDLYVDLETELPAGMVVRQDDGGIDTAYFYADLNTNVALNDADFRMEIERGAAVEKKHAASAQ